MGHQHHSNTKGKAPRLVQPRKEQLASMGEDLGELPEDDDEDIDLASDQVEVVNVSPGSVKFKVAGRTYKLRPGEIAQLEAAYGTPRIMRAGGDPMPSTVELETQRKVLPVLDHRVPKNDAGMPLVSIEMNARRLEAAQAKRAGV